MGRAFEVRKRAMEKTQGAKSKIYSKYGKEIYVVAKNGGTDPDANLSLRSLIEKAKKDQVPAHVIDKAIAKAEGGGGESYETARFEGFGPNNTMLIVECLTDNNNRTFGDVRLCFTKTKQNLGVEGAVSHMFNHYAVFAFNHDDEDAILELLMEADVDVADIESDDGMITVFAPTTEFAKARAAIVEGVEGVEFEMQEISFIPMSYQTLEGEDLDTFEKLIDMLNDVDDVQNIYHNAEFA